MSIDTELAEAIAKLSGPLPPPPEYRLHYNTNGEIYLGTMWQHPENTNYVVVTKEQYETYIDFKVVNGTIQKIQQEHSAKVQLVKSDKGFKVVKNHAALILEDKEDLEEVEYYEIRTS